MQLSSAQALKRIADDFIELALAYQVLQFGRFTLKSGRVSPYFFNMGLFHDGRALKHLGDYYAALYRHYHLNTPIYLGLLIKGISLAGATAIALSEDFPAITVTYNRKEAKTHGEGGGVNWGAAPGGCHDYR